jgi:hypothetical protein
MQKMASEITTSDEHGSPGSDVIREEAETCDRAEQQSDLKRIEEVESHFAEAMKAEPE